MTGALSWYDVLGVDPGASDEELRAAHRVASKRLHPDAGGSAAEFQLVQTAYEVLADPVARADHDRELRGDTAAPSRLAPAPRPGPAARPASAPSTPLPPPPGGCLTPWVVVAAGVAIVVAVLVTIATLSSSSDPTGSAPGTTVDADAPGPRSTPTGAAAPGATTPRTGLPGPVTTLEATELPADFPRGHVPLPVDSRLEGVVVAGSGSGTPTVTIRATGRGTDAERAAINYASTLQAAGWTAAPDEDPDLATSDVVRRSLVDSDGSLLQFVVTEADGGGLQYIIGFHQVRR